MSLLGKRTVFGTLVLNSVALTGLLFLPSTGGVSLKSQEPTSKLTPQLQKPEPQKSTTAVALRLQDPTPQPEPQPPTPAPQPPLIQGQDVVQQYRLVRLNVSNIPTGHFILWDVYPIENVDPATQRLKSLYEFAAPPGVYRVRVRAFDRKAPENGTDLPLEAWRTITIQGPPQPVPPGPSPVPPGPTPPGPTPPGPTPPTPAPPIPGDGNRMLIVYESSETLPNEQAAILTSGVLRDYLDAKTIKDTANPNGAYRIWDKDVPLQKVSESWKAAITRPRTGTPWIIISSGKTGYEGPLPKSVPETLTLLKKYFGE